MPIGVLSSYIGSNSFLPELIPYFILELVVANPLSF